MDHHLKLLETIMEPVPNTDKQISNQIIWFNVTIYHT